MAKSGEAVRDWLDAAADAARRARRDPADEKALHRFRVNARRILVYAQAAGEARGVPAKARKRLRRALRDTGPWRDAHVEAMWMSDYAAGRDGDRGAAALRKALRRRRACPPPDPDWWRRLDSVLRKIRRAARTRSPDRAELSAARREAAEREWRRLARRLRRLNRASGRTALHKARVSAKKLRYLLEWPGPKPRGLPGPGALRRLQTALGDVHDRDVIAGDVAAAGRGPGLAGPSRAALARLARERRRALSDAVRRWKSLPAGRRAR